MSPDGRGNCAGARGIASGKATPRRVSQRWKRTRGSAARGYDPRPGKRTRTIAGKAPEKTQGPPASVTREESKGPLTQRTRRARRMRFGAPDNGVTRGSPTADA